MLAGSGTVESVLASTGVAGSTTSATNAPTVARSLGVPPHIPTVYLVSAPPAHRSEFGPSAAYTFPSASTATPSPAAPWYALEGVSAGNGGMKAVIRSSSTRPR